MEDRDETPFNQETSGAKDEAGEGYGFLYVLSNPSMPGYLKIGQTERHPASRAAELSNHSGIPTPFKIELFYEVSKRLAAERAVHTALADKRASPDREFFLISVQDARLAVLRAAAEFLCSNVSIPLPNMVVLAKDR